MRGGLTEVQSENLVVSNGLARYTSRFESPGALLAEVYWTEPDGRNRRSVGGAVAAPERIKASASRPRDFDRFWRSKIEELKQIPANPQLDRAESGRDDAGYWKVTLDNIGNTKVRGQLARPLAGEKFPALLIVQWAGVYPLSKDWVTWPAHGGWLTLNIQAHDLPVDGDDAFFRAQRQGPLADYANLGNTNRDSSYFLRMYLGCYRAAEYLANRPDWDGRTLVVMGGSQGGMQALATAALHPGITAAIANVPAGCDVLGSTIGRAPGWPKWNVAGSPLVGETARYFDVVNFAARIQCPVLIGVGLRDEVCPPEGILAAANQIRSPKEIILLPNAGHSGEQRAHEALENRRDSVWLPALAAGRLPPVAAERQVSESRAQ